jgi:predicted site-specific integrase-resolvase
MDAIVSEKWYSVKEVAGILRVDRETVRRWIIGGWLRVLELPHESPFRHRVYISRRVSGSELERLIRIRTTELNEVRRHRAA